MIKTNLAKDDSSKISEKSTFSERVQYAFNSSMPIGKMCEKLRAGSYFLEPISDANINEDGSISTNSNNKDEKSNYYNFDSDLISKVKDLCIKCGVPLETMIDILKNHSIEGRHSSVIRAVSLAFSKQGEIPRLFDPPVTNAARSVLNAIKNIHTSGSIN